MSILDRVIASLEGTPAILEAYDRHGELSRRLDGSGFARTVAAFRSAFRGWDDRGRKVVALLFRPEETVEFLVVAFAAFAERFTIVPLYPNWSADTQKQYLDAYKLRSVAVGAGFRSRAEGWASGGDMRVIPIDLDSPPPGNAAFELLDLDLPGDHSCAWIFTSGTTGKLARLTDITLSNIAAAIENIRRLDFLHAGMTVHCPLSASHIFAFVCGLGFLSLRPKRVIFSDVQYMARLPRSRTGKIDAMILVPIVLNRMRTGFYEKLAAPIDRRTALPELRRLSMIPLPVRRALKRVVLRAEEAILRLETTGRVSAWGWCAVTLSRRLFGRLLADRLGAPKFVVVGGAKPNLGAMAFLEVMGVRCLQGWGMTETTGPLCVCSLSDRFRGAFGTAGTLFAETRAWIDDGELVVEGPQVARGYREPDGTFVPFQGRKKTGDQARIDRSGRIQILGKAGQRITTANGLNYDPVPLEEEVLALDLSGQNWVEEVVIIGDGQPSLGAVFFLRPGVKDGPETQQYLGTVVRQFNDRHAVDERIGPWTVHGRVLRETEFLGPTGKLIRRRVEEGLARIFDASGEA